jgi:DNA polymerase III epsilon subunit family exonuclease
MINKEDDLLVFIDVETTGLSSDYDRIIQICIMSKSHSFVTYVNPKRPLDPRAMAINGITEEDVRNAPTFEEIASTIKELLDGKIIIGHNVCFDLRFLTAELKSTDNCDRPFEYICTMALEKMILGKGNGTGFYTLKSCLERIGATNEKAHDAFHDVLATKRLFEHQIERIEDSKEVIKKYPSEQRLQQRERIPKLYTSLREFAAWGTLKDKETVEKFNRFMERALNDGNFSESEFEELSQLRIDKVAAQAELTKAVVAVFSECIDDGIISLDEYEFIEETKSALGLNAKQLYPVFKKLLPTLRIACFDMMPYMNEDGTFFVQEREGDVESTSRCVLSEKEVFRFALYKGYYPTRSVTKETDLCVNGHPDLHSHTQTRKADKYGIPVVKFAEFAAEIDIPVISFLVRLPDAVIEYDEESQLF